MINHELINTLLWESFRFSAMVLLQSMHLCSLLPLQVLQPHIELSPFNGTLEISLYKSFIRSTFFEDKRYTILNNFLNIS